MLEIHVYKCYHAQNEVKFVTSCLYPDKSSPGCDTLADMFTTLTMYILSVRCWTFLSVAVHGNVCMGVFQEQRVMFVCIKNNGWLGRLVFTQCF